MNQMQADLSGVDPLVVNLAHRLAVGDMPTRAAQTFGKRVALIQGGHSVTYAQLEARSNAVARGLLGQGLRRGEALALQMGNRWEFLVTLFACAKIGVVVLPVNLALSAKDIAYQLVDSGAVAVATEEMWLPTLQQALELGRGHAVRFVQRIGSGPATLGDLPVHDWADGLTHDTAVVEAMVEDRDVLQCLYTSGTTAAPKGVLTSHLAVQMAVMSTALHLGLRPRGHGQTISVVLPMFHTTALNVLVMPFLLTGGTVILHSGFDAGKLVDDIATRGTTHLMLLPMMWNALLAQPRLREVDTHALQLALYAMAPMPGPLLEALRQTFPNAEVILGSGQTETTPANELQWPEHQGVKDDSWGAPTVMSDVRIMGEGGRLLPRGEEGEIVYRSPQLMAGYWNNGPANTAAFAHGWFHGGDVGYIDDEGVVWFTDRTKDMVKTGGENVASVEVERALLAHPDVAECAVVGLPDERWGEAVTAFVVLGPGARADAAALTAHCKERLAGFKVPKLFRFVGSLPKTATGKITKHTLRGQKT
ncbi:MAG TPA: AMP-binding protein [Rubrivivax sp.]|nr:AMP-binding protein [Rubrivivax sp.]